MELQRRLGLEQSRLDAAEAVVKVVDTNLGKAPLSDLSVGRLREWLGGRVEIASLPDSLAAILATPGDAGFFDRWVALAGAVGTATPSTRPSA